MTKRVTSKKMASAKGAAGKTVTIGRTGGMKISAVEGIHLSGEMRDLFKSFDEQDLSPKQRRARLAARYGKKSA